VTLAPVTRAATLLGAVALLAGACGGASARPARIVGNDAVHARLGPLPPLPIDPALEIRRASVRDLRAFCGWQARAVGAYDVETTCRDGARVRIASWLVLNGLCSFVNQYVSLSVLDAMASPLSYALAQVMKRATVITVAMAYTWKPVTLLHGSGIALSLAGALCYQYAHVLYQPERGGRAADVEATEARYELVGIMKPSPGSKLTTVLEAEDSTDSTSSSEAGDETEASLLDIAAHRDGGRPGRGLGT
jgi:hypothetical protein